MTEFALAVAVFMLAAMAITGWGSFGFALWELFREQNETARLRAKLRILHGEKDDE